MYTLLVLTALAQPAPKPDAPSGVPPTQMLARIDGRGTLALSYATSLPGGGCSGGYGGGCYGGGYYGYAPSVISSRTPSAPPAKAPPKVKVTTLMVTTAELSAKHVEAYTADGRTVTAEKLAKLLAKDRPVLVALDGNKPDPFLLQLYKEDAIVLVLPANTLGSGYGGSSTLPYPRTPEKGPDRPPSVKRPADKGDK